MRNRLPPFAAALVPLAAALLPLAGCGGPVAPAWPHAPVQLVVDGLGITHVLAGSDADAFYGSGYAMARDRLFQMEYNRRRARGTLAELFGKALLASDEQARVVGFARLGVADMQRMRAESPDDAQLFDAWAAGINARLAELRAGKAPPEPTFAKAGWTFVPDDWTAEDGAAVGKLLAFGLSNTLQNDLLATLAMNTAAAVVKDLPLTMPAYDTFIVPWPAKGGGPNPMSLPVTDGSEGPAQGGGSREPVHAPPVGAWGLFGDVYASNNWAVDGAHSANGRPLLAGDPHQNLTSPVNFWPVHLDSTDGGGTLDVVGFAFVGTPTVELGHNAHVAWTATTNFADVMDAWDVDVGGFDQAHLGDGAHPIVKRTESMKVRVPGAPVGMTTTTEVDLYEVPGYGVLLPDETLPVPRSFLAKGQLLFNWTGLRPTREGLAYLAMDRARSLDELDRAVDGMNVGAVNVVAADATGIDYRVHVDVPDRGDPGKHAMPWHVLGGMDAQSLWNRGFLDAAHLPHARAPAKGYLLSANNDPFGFTADGDVQNDPFYYGAWYANGFRAHRIDEALGVALAKGTKLARSDMEDLQADVHSDLADTLLPLLDQAVRAIGTDPALAGWIGRRDLADMNARLQAWDRNDTVDGGQPVAFTGFAWFAALRAFSAFPPSLFDGIQSRSPPYFLGQLRNVAVGRTPNAAVFAPNGVSALLLAALDDTASWLMARFGTLNPGGIGPKGSSTWGDLNTACFPSPWGSPGGSLDGGCDGVAGGNDTIRVVESPFFKMGTPLDVLVASESSLYRMAVDFADDGEPEATLDFARGTREEPTDPHFGDQDPGWVAATHVPLPFRRADVEAAATDQAILPAHP